jgi:hypothetical protein
MQRAAASLAQTNHSVFNPGQFKVTYAGLELADGWGGKEIETVTVSAPSTVTRAWRVHFWPNQFLAFLPENLTREEAMQVGENLKDLTNMRRAGS